MYEAFNDPEVEVVLNLTRPYEHYGVTKAALEHGKHVFSEKPLAADMEEGDELVALAEEKGLLMGARRIRSWARAFRPCASLSMTGTSATLLRRTAR